MTTTTRTPVETFDRELLWHDRARLSYVHDGDTLTVLADVGYRARYEPAIRLLNCYADELWTPAGKQAAAALKDFVKSTPDGWGLRVVTKQLETVVAEDTTFERWVADVYQVDADGSLHNIGDWMVANGHASREPTAKSVREGIASPPRFKGTLHEALDLVRKMEGVTHGQ